MASLKMTKAPKFEASFTNLDLSEFSTSGAGESTYQSSLNNNNNNNSNNNSNKLHSESLSASAQLMQIKQQEIKRKMHEEEEERKMQQMAAMKNRDQLKRLRDETIKDNAMMTSTMPLSMDRNMNGNDNMNKSNEGRTSESGCIFGALVSMHGADKSGGRKERKSVKTKAQKRAVASKFKASLSKKKKVVRSSRR